MSANHYAKLSRHIFLFSITVLAFHPSLTFAAVLATCPASQIANPGIAIEKQWAALSDIVNSEVIERKPKLEVLSPGSKTEAISPSKEVISTLIDPKNPWRMLSLEVRKRAPKTKYDFAQDEITLVEYYMNQNPLVGRILNNWTMDEATRAVGLTADEAIEVGFSGVIKDGKKNQTQLETLHRNAKLISTSDGNIAIAFGIGLLLSKDGGVTLKPVKNLRKYRVLDYQVDPKSRQKLLLTQRFKSETKLVNGKYFTNIQSTYYLFGGSGHTVKLELPKLYSIKGESNESPRIVRTHPDKPNVVYLGTGKRIFECTTFPNCSESSWKDSYKKVSSTKDDMHYDSTVYDISFDSKFMYAATCNGVYKRPKSGGTWGKIRDPEVFNFDITASELNYRIQTHITPSGYLRSETIRINPKHPNQMAIASEGRVFFSNNSGNSWRALPIPSGPAGGPKNIFAYNQTWFLPDGSLAIAGSVRHDSKETPIYRVMP